ncbi:MAG: hypothetical protein BMS9Abin12_2172 [Acidimicrobiia bacterium]|nr:MAG: hypothetical protein BMS9Abin12_2172 [Acidimicrobiia bacterium]
MTLDIEPTRGIDFQNSSDQAQIARLWSAAAGSEFAMSQRMVASCAQPAADVLQSGRFAVRDGRLIGLVWVTAAFGLNRESGLSGFIEMLCVDPKYQGHGTADQLLDWAEDTLAVEGCERVVLGGGFRWPLNAVPLELGSVEYFHSRGYVDGVPVWDVVRDLDGFEADYEIGQDDVSMVEASESDVEELFEFLRTTFPRWGIELADHRRAQDRLSDYLILRLEGTLQGFCKLTFEGSRNPLERFLGSPLPRPWGELGPIGLSEAVRGRGLGGALLREGLSFLRGKGVRGCRICWTPLPGFYETAGFRREREFVMMAKDLDQP